MSIQSNTPLWTLLNIQFYAPLGIVVVVIIGLHVHAYTVIDTPPITSGAVIDHNLIILIASYVRAVVATTITYMHPIPALIALIYIILFLPNSTSSSGHSDSCSSWTPNPLGGYLQASPATKIMNISV